MHKAKFKQITFFEIPENDRAPECPIRIRVGLSPEFAEKIGKKMEETTR
jgi:hypothetical protein